MSEQIKPNFKDKDKLKDEIWWGMCDVGMSPPQPLRKADLSKEFVYDRRYGVFYCDFAKHQFAMALLLSWDQGVENYLDIDNEKLGISHFRSSDVMEFADYFLENTAGTCFKSSVSKKIIAGKKGNLNDMELDYFSPVVYLLKVGE